MIGSRLCLFVLALFGVGAMTLALVYPRTLQRELDGQIEARLVSADNAAGQLLRLNARKWLDAAAEAASDAVLEEALVSAARGGTTMELVHETARERLRELNRSLGASFLLVTDLRGRVVARAGRDDELWKDELGSRPVIGEALRGYRADDTWDLEGTLYRVAVSPVIPPTNDRYVGALVVGQELGSEAAAHLRDTLGVDVAFLCRGKVVGQSSALSVLGELPRLTVERAADLAAEKHTEVLPVVAGERAFQVILAPLVGSAAASEPVIALAAERRQVSTALGALGTVGLSGLSPRELAIVASVLSLVVLLGFWLMGWEQGRPIRRLLDDLHSKRGMAGRIELGHHRGRWRILARAVNAVIQRAERVGGSTGEESGAGAPTNGVPEVSSVQLLPSQPAPPPVEPRASTLPAVPAVRTGAPDRRTRTNSPAVLLDPTSPASTTLVEVSIPTLTPPPPVAVAARTTTEMSGPIYYDAAAAPTVDHGDGEDDYQAVFREYVATKRSCGESTDTLSFDRFVNKLRQNREQLIIRYNCKTVRFQVYVKDGKAALKATPVGAA